MTLGLHTTFQVDPIIRRAKFPWYCQGAPLRPRSIEASNCAWPASPCWVIRFMLSTRLAASSCRYAVRSSVVTTAGLPVVSDAAVRYWPCSQASRNCCTVGSADGSGDPALTSITASNARPLTTAMARFRVILARRPRAGQTGRRGSAWARRTGAVDGGSASGRVSGRAGGDAGGAGASGSSGRAGGDAGGAGAGSSGRPTGGAGGNCGGTAGGAGGAADGGACADGGTCADGATNGVDSRGDGAAGRATGISALAAGTARVSPAGGPSGQADGLGATGNSRAGDPSAGLPAAASRAGAPCPGHADGLGLCR